MASVFDYLFQGNSDASTTKSGVPGQWDPDLKKFWDEFMAAWPDYKANLESDNEYLKGVGERYKGATNTALQDYTTNLGGIQDKYSAPSMNFNLGNMPVSMVGKGALELLKTLGTQEGDIYDKTVGQAKTVSDTDIANTPNKSYFELMDALGPMAWKGMQNRYDLPTETSTADLSNTPSLIDTVGSILKLSGPAGKAWDAISNGLGLGTTGTAGTTGSLPIAGDVVNGATTSWSPNVASGLGTTTGTLGGAVAPTSSAVNSGLMTGAEAGHIAASGANFVPAATGANVANAGTMASGVYPAAYWAVPVAQALWGASILNKHNQNDPSAIGGSNILNAAQGKEMNFVRGGDQQREVKIETDDNGNRWLYDPWATKQTGKPVWYNLDDEKTLEWARQRALEEGAVAVPGNKMAGDWSGQQNEVWKDTVNQLDPSGKWSDEINAMLLEAFDPQKLNRSNFTGMGR